MKQGRRYKTKTKAERQQWWNNLTPNEKEIQIKKWQAQKAKKRKFHPLPELEYNPKYPWLTEGVNDSNRAQWWAIIKKKNPWLKVA